MSFLSWTRWSVPLPFQCVFMSFSEKDMGQVDGFDTTVVFHSLTGGLALIRAHYTILFSCTVFILTAPLWFLISFCGANIPLHLASPSGSVRKRRKVTPPKYIRDHGKETPYSVLPLNAASLCHFLSTHSNMCEWLCTYTYARKYPDTYTHVVAAHFI